jgi:hypothetical protein
MQNGLGRYGTPQSSSASAVSAFSPPESSRIFCSRLPGGCAGDIDSRFAGAVRLAQAHFAVPAAEQRLERDREMRVDES